MRLLREFREWGLPVTVITVWWFALVWALTIAMAPKPEPSHSSPKRPPIAAKVDPRRS